MEYPTLNPETIKYILMTLGKSPNKNPSNNLIELYRYEYSRKDNYAIVYFSILPPEIRNLILTFTTVYHPIILVQSKIFPNDSPTSEIKDWLYSYFHLLTLEILDFWTTKDSSCHWFYNLFERWVKVTDEQVYKLEKKYGLFQMPKDISIWEISGYASIFIAHKRHPNEQCFLSEMFDYNMNWIFKALQLGFPLTELLSSIIVNKIIGQKNSIMTSGGYSQQLFVLPFQEINKPNDHIMIDDKCNFLRKIMDLLDRDQTDMFNQALVDRLSTNFENLWEDMNKYIELLLEHKCSHIEILSLLTKIITYPSNEKFSLFLSILPMLKKYDFDINFSSQQNRNLLFNTVARRDLKLIKLLVENGAKVYEVNEDNNTIKTSRSKDSIDAIFDSQQICRSKLDNCPVSIFEYLLSQFEKKDQPKRATRCLFQIFSEYNSGMDYCGIRITEICFSLGANWVERNEKLETLFHIVVQSKKNEFLKYLLQKFTEKRMTKFFNTQDVDGMTPLMVAVVQSYLYGVAMLLMAKVDPNLKNNIGQTALDIAVYNGNNEIVDILKMNMMNK